MIDQEGPCQYQQQCNPATSAQFHHAVGDGSPGEVSAEKGTTGPAVNHGLQGNPPPSTMAPALLRPMLLRVNVYSKRKPTSPSGLNSIVL